MNLNFISKNRKLFSILTGPYAALIVLLSICCISSEPFRDVTNLLNIIRQVSFSGIIALGMTFVIIGGGIDLAVGSLMALSGVFAVMTMNSIPGNEVLAILLGITVALATGLVGGSINGLLTSLGKIPPFIVTLGTLSIFRSLALYFADAGLVSSKIALFAKLGSFSILGIPLPVATLFILTIVFAILLTKTSFGRYVCAIGSSEQVAKFAGINTALVKFSTYVIASICSSISAILFASRLNGVSSTSAGTAYELDAIAAVIIGGTAMSGGKGSIFGTLAGIFILGIVSNILDMWGVSVNLQGAVKGLVIIIAVLIQKKERN